MKEQALRMVAVETCSPVSTGVVIGRLSGSTTQGEPLVDYPGNVSGPVVARVSTAAVQPEGTDAEVLLAFEDNDGERPIILGFLEKPGQHRRTLGSGVIESEGTDGPTVEGRALVFNGRESIALTCGKSSITLYADGRVIVKGTRLLSRASESNKIKGATIALN